MWAYGRRQTNTQTRVTTIHFASSSTHAKCNNSTLSMLCLVAISAGFVYSAVYRVMSCVATYSVVRVCVCRWNAVKMYCCCSSSVKVSASLCCFIVQSHLLGMLRCGQLGWEGIGACPTSADLAWLAERFACTLLCNWASFYTVSQKTSHLWLAIILTYTIRLR